MKNLRQHHIDTATMLYKHGNFEQARALLEHIATENPCSADIFNMLGVIYHDAQLFFKAQAAFEKALAIDPDCIESSINLSIIYNDLGKYKEGQQAYTQAIHAYQNKQLPVEELSRQHLAQDYICLGHTYQQACAIPEAIHAYQQALQLQPTAIDNHLRLAHMLIINRQYTEAMPLLQYVLEKQPHDTFARVQYGFCCYAIEGRQQEALQHWCMVLAQEPNHPQAACYLAMASQHTHG